MLRFPWKETLFTSRLQVKIPKETIRATIISRSESESSRSTKSEDEPKHKEHSAGDQGWTLNDNFTFKQQVGESWENRDKPLGKTNQTIFGTSEM